MSINIDNVFGIHESGVLLRSKRAEVIASNIANADTPGYKAKGMDFQKALQAAANNQSSGLATTNDKHLSTSNNLTSEIKYRVSNQPDTGDGNTVDAQVERNLYMKNTLEYQASVQFVTGAVKGITKSIRGTLT